MKSRMSTSIVVLVGLVLIGSCGGDTGGVAGEEEETGGVESSGLTPTLSESFAAAGSRWVKSERIAGGIVFGTTDTKASDGKALRVALPAGPAKGTRYALGPTKGNQVATSQALSYGTYRVRARAAACTASLSRPEEVITGIFVYANGGDANGNGLTDNNEIDIEFACSAPHLVSLSVWTDYDEDSGEERKTTRVVDLRTGYYGSGEPTEEEHDGVIDGLADTAFNAASAYHEMGFEWTAERVRFFFGPEGQEVTLWEVTDPVAIPRPPASFMMNVWHDQYVWFVSEALHRVKRRWDVAAYYPATDAALFADWFKYWAQ